MDAPGRAGERLPVPRRRDGSGPSGPAAPRIPDVLVDLAARPSGPGRGRLPRGGHGPAWLRRLRPPPARIRPVHPLRGRQWGDPLPGGARRGRGRPWMGRFPGVDGRRHPPGGDPGHRPRVDAAPAPASRRPAGRRRTAACLGLRLRVPDAGVPRARPAGERGLRGRGPAAGMVGHPDLAGRPHRGHLPRGHAAAEHRPLCVGVPPVGTALGAATRRNPLRQADEGTHHGPRAARAGRGGPDRAPQQRTGLRRLRNGSLRVRRDSNGRTLPPRGATQRSSTP